MMMVMMMMMDGDDVDDEDDDDDDKFRFENVTRANQDPERAYWAPAALLWPYGLPNVSYAWRTVRHMVVSWIVTPHPLLIRTITIASASKQCITRSMQML